MEDINIFEYAAKNKLRFQYRGLLSTEDLYNLSVEELDKIYKALNAELKKEKEDSLLVTRSSESCEISIKIAIVKQIVADKQAAEQAASKSHEQKMQRQKIMAIIAEKDDVALRNMSKDELLALLNHNGQ